MVKHTVHSFDKELLSLTERLSSMSGLVSKQLGIAILAWNSRSSELITQSRDIDHDINIIDYEIEQDAYSLLALRQPMGVDLRMIVSSLKLSVTLERMGDLTKGITTRACRLSFDLDEDINKQCNVILQRILDLFSNIKPLLKMEEISMSCSDIAIASDEIHGAMIDLVKNINIKIKEQINLLEEYMNILFAIKSMERLCQSINKISRVSFYIHSGKKVLKHEIGPVLEEI